MDNQVSTIRQLVNRLEKATSSAERIETLQSLKVQRL